MYNVLFHLRMSLRYLKSAKKFTDKEKEKLNELIQTAIELAEKMNQSC